MSETEEETTGRDIRKDSLDLSNLQSVCASIFKEEVQTQPGKEEKKSETETLSKKEDKENIKEDNNVKSDINEERESGIKEDRKSDIKEGRKEEGKGTSATGDSKEKMKVWLMNSVRILLEHLNKFGVCVVDDFLGEERGALVLQEVQALQDNDCFQAGQVMSGGGLHEPSIRSDKITWTDGVNPVNSPALRHLIQLLDSIVMTANRVPNNGELGKYRINGRTKIMVACYPGEGSHYVRHVDNPNRDGRVVTAIYYLNKDWDSQLDGGSLKIYTQVNNGAVAKVDPLFDRIVFFWSDSRNPHEVLPSNRPRYAVTVWYLDETEKRVYERRRQEAAAAASRSSIQNPR